jgi:preprotein translocase subunit SecD
MLRRSGLLPLVLIVALAAGSLGAVLGTGSSPKLGLDLAGGFSVTLQPDGPATEDTLDQAIEIIRSRVDGLGAAEPEITRQGSTIVVNLPGVTDRERATELVGTTAELRFRPVVCAVPDLAALGVDPDELDLPDDADLPQDAVPEGEPPDGPGADDGVAEDDAADGADTEEEGVEGQAVRSAATPFQQDPDDEAPEDGPATDDATEDDATEDDATEDDATEDEAPPGDEPITEEELLEQLEGLPGQPGPTGDASLLCSRLRAGELVEPTTRDDDPPDQAAVLPYDDPQAGPQLLVVGPTAVTGDAITGARAQLDQTGVRWIVGIDIGGGAANQAFNELAAMCFSSMGDCADGRSAIALDSEVVTALGYQEPSFAGTAQITGDFDERRARDLALVLRYGSLPVQLETQETEVVSATLGRDALEAGLTAGIIGLAIVAIYMVAYYRLLGLVAIGSLAVSASLLWAVVSWLGETQGLALTLAGITGIIVSIGVAVDSNVVFYENLKEDVSRGRTLRSAVSGSFTAAFSTIVKANVATLIGAALLYWLTVGPVRGFALFLGLATALDMVASYFFMRPLVISLARSPRFQDRPRALGMRPAVATPVTEVVQP